MSYFLIFDKLSCWIIFISWISGVSTVTWFWYIGFVSQLVLKLKALNLELTVIQHFCYNYQTFDFCWLWRINLSLILSFVHLLYGWTHFSFRNLPFEDVMSLLKYVYTVVQKPLSQYKHVIFTSLLNWVYGVVQNFSLITGVKVSWLP